MTLITQSLSLQLMTISIITLQRQLLHNEASNRNQWNNTYDYVVVGAGSAGAIVAARLTEDPNVNVLLIEAGVPQTVTTDMLSNSLLGLIGRVGDMDWQYRTTPQKRAGYAYRDRRMLFPRGRVLGGSSTTNLAIYNRGNRRDYDNWANRYGATGWAYSDVLPYFMRMENQTNPLYAANTAYHSTTGPLAVSSPPNPDPILLRYIEGWNREGLPTVDINGGTQLGTTLLQKTVSADNRTRSSTANRYLEPLIRNRNNLHVVCHSLVTRVLLQNNSTNGLTATGIEFQRNGNTYTVGVRREVILSAGISITDFTVILRLNLKEFSFSKSEPKPKGAINSPQILMLSGIGPRQHLQDMSIPVQIDLSVGNNLMDHIGIPMDYLVVNESDILYSRDMNTINSVQNLYDYYINNSGPLIQMPSIFTYLSSRFTADPDWPDGIILTLPTYLSLALSEMGQNVEEWEDYYNGLAEPSTDRRHFTIAYGVYGSRSRGTVRLASTDPSDAPLIDPNYYENNYDLGVAVDTMSTGMRMTEQPFFRQYARIYNKTIPGCRMCDSGLYYECYSYLACIAQTLTFTSWHPVGTCRMGNASNPEAVVDTQLRVRGVSGLRVIDASVMPHIINGNTNAASMMIGERGADLVRFGR